ARLATSIPRSPPMWRLRPQAVAFPCSAGTSVDLADIGPAALDLARARQAGHYVQPAHILNTSPQEGPMPIRTGLLVCLCVVGTMVVFDRPFSAQTLGEPEEFNATAIVNNNLGSGAGMVLIRVTRWSTEAETMRLLSSLKTKGPEKLLDEL